MWRLAAVCGCLHLLFLFNPLKVALATGSFFALVLLTSKTRLYITSFNSNGNRKTHILYD